MIVKAIQPYDVQPGDIANHVNRTLDPRRVTRVEVDANAVWIDVGGREAGPFWLDTYTYTRRNA